MQLLLEFINEIHSFELDHFDPLNLQYLFKKINPDISSEFLDFEITIHDDLLIFVKSQIKGELIGGKGGFGAQLRSLAKQKGAKRTTNFGACRDLSGRRLRHVNDEIILNKWKEAQEKGEEFDVEQNTSSGVDLWFMGTPGWAENDKSNKKRKFLKAKRKTSLCLDWVRARENSNPPPGAPYHWGCSRGANCDFAHGDEELKGTLKEISIELEEKKKQEEATKLKKYYFDPLETADSANSDILDIVKEGLMASKRVKREKQKKLIMNQINESDDYNILKGNFHISVESFSAPFSLTSIERFSTLVLKAKNIQFGDYSYSVELNTNGLMQIGWSTDNFTLLEDDDGVGDDLMSWSFDGYRQKIWHIGKSYDYGPQSEETWKIGDIITCKISIQNIIDNLEEKNVIMSFFLNEEDFGEAFNFQIPISNCFYPTLSLENSESISIQI